MAVITVWVAYNSDNQCFASHESAPDAIQGLDENFGYGEGARVVELRLTLPSVKPLAVQAVVPDREGPVSVTIE